MELQVKSLTKVDIDKNSLNLKWRTESSAGAMYVRGTFCARVLSWSKRLECFAKQDPGRARQSS